MSDKVTQKYFMYNTHVKPIKIFEPVKYLTVSIDTSGVFEKKFIDSEGNRFNVEINVKKKTGTITKYRDEEFKTPAIKVNLKKLEEANKLFEEAEYEYKCINVQII